MAASQRWGFDFVRGQPMTQTDVYLWERVPPTNDIPEMYTLSRAAHARPSNMDLLRSPRSQSRNHNRIASSYIDLLDERAEKANKMSNNGLLDLSFEDVDGHSAASSCDESSFEEVASRPISNSSSSSNTNISTGNSSSHLLLHHSRHHEDVLMDSLVATVPTPCLTMITRSSSQSSSHCQGQNSNIRCSPRNREKRQPKITGEWLAFLFVYLMVVVVVFLIQCNDCTEPHPPSVFIHHKFDAHRWSALRPSQPSAANHSVRSIVIWTISVRVDEGHSISTSPSPNVRYEKKKQKKKPKIINE